MNRISELFRPRPLPSWEQQDQHRASTFHSTLRLMWLALLLAGSGGAMAAVLGEAELRSYLGEPLSLRVQISSGEEEVLDAGCFSLTRETQPFSILRSAQIELVQVRSTQMLNIRTTATLNEPFIRIGLRYACAGQGTSSREYTLLLDPPPAITPPVVQSTTPAAVRLSSPAGGTLPPTGNQASLPRSTGQWLVTSADSLAAIAEGIYPKSVKRKARYIAALRALNPSLSGLADDATIPIGVTLTLPDLRALSAPERNIVATEPARRAAPTQPARREPAPLTKPPAVDNVGTGKTTPSGARKQEKPAQSRKAPLPAPNGEFSLRLSGSEMDLTRSANVTEEQRALLREKQFFLDADDQLAQFLALKNAVKQLETRLNDIQSRLPPALGSAVPPSQATTIPVPQPAQPAQIATRMSGFLDDIAGLITRPFTIVVAALVALSAFVIIWWRRKSTVQKHRTVLDIQPVGEAAVEALADAPAMTEDAVALAEAQPIAHVVDPQAEADELALALRARRLADATPTPPNFTFDQASFDATVSFNAEDFSPEDPGTADRFDLDDSPSTSVDFPIDGAGLAGDEERVRRLQYMQKRYPELQQNTISLDDPDSVINAARHYLEDTVDRADASPARAIGTDKASELLGFALEERPQEMRYWLAQFEVFRIEGLVSEYAELASQFHILFGHSTEWPQVKSIGRELSPTNPLFAPAGDEATDHTSTETTDRNWLNQLSTPALDARRDLAVLLRQSLLEPRAASGDRK